MHAEMQEFFKNGMEFGWGDGGFEIALHGLAPFTFGNLRFHTLAYELFGSLRPKTQ
jgi:hypothetical protein